MVTVSVAVLLERSGSPSTVFSTALLLVKSPSRMPRNTVMGTVTVPPWASTPPVWVQMTVSRLLTAQLKVAVLPAPATVATTGVTMLDWKAPEARNAGTVSEMRTPVASSAVGDTLVTTSV